MSKILTLNYFNSSSWARFTEGGNVLNFAQVHGYMSVLQLLRVWPYVSVKQMSSLICTDTNVHVALWELGRNVSSHHLLWFKVEQTVTKI